MTDTTRNACCPVPAVRWIGLLAVACGCVLFVMPSTARAQNFGTVPESGPAGETAGRALSATLPDAELAGMLERRGHLTLRDVTVVEALMALREQWKVDMVIPDDVTGQVNATFSGASLREILDSLLLTRGFGYQVVGRSIVILPLDQLSALKPLFRSEVIRLQYADPNELISVVDLLLSPQGKALPLPSSQSILVLDYPDRMSLIESRLAELDRSAGETQTPVLQHSPGGGPADGTGPDGTGMVRLDVRVFRPQFVKVESLLPAIESLISRNGRVAVLEKEDQVIVADEASILDVIEEAVAALDQPRPQVRIWAMIYDCSLDDVERLGVNWRSAGFGNGRRANGTPRNQVLLNAITAAAPAVGVPNGALSLMSLGTNIDINAVINALRQSNDSRLLADPNVVVTNHEPARISIVTEVPYQQLTQGLEGGAIGTTAFREAGVSLEVTPHIARDGTISMLVNPQFSVLTGFTENDEQPIIDRREAKTTVRVTSGETFVLGGLRQRTRINNRSGIPYLKDVRYVGKLFRYQQESFRDSELLVFITPEIVSVNGDPRPREVAAEAFSHEELNWNRRAPDVDRTSLEFDAQSLGGPWRQLDANAGFGFTGPLEGWEPQAEAVAGLPQAGDAGSSAESAVLPPYVEETPPFVQGPTSSETESRPLTQHLKGTIHTIDQSTAPGGQHGASLPELPGTGGSAPAVNLESLLNILPMSAESAGTVKRETPTGTAGDRGQWLKYEVSSPVSPQRRPPSRPPRVHSNPSQPVSVAGPAAAR